MAAVREGLPLRTGEPEPGLVHQRRRVQQGQVSCLADALARQTLKVAIQLRHHLVGGGPVALTGVLQQFGDVLHGAEL